MLVNDDYLEGMGWVQVGNTWYPPVSALPPGYKSDLPLVYWVRVDGTARIPGTDWRSRNNITQHQFCQLLAGLGIAAPLPNETSEAARITELERLNLEAQNRIGDLCVVVGNIEQCRAVEGDSVTILCDNPEADDIETQGAVEVCGDYTGYEPQRFYGKTWEEAIAKAARVAQRHYTK